MCVNIFFKLPFIEQFWIPVIMVTPYVYYLTEFLEFFNPYFSNEETLAQRERKSPKVT